jgi:hypothetical protein
MPRLLVSAVRVSSSCYPPSLRWVYRVASWSGVNLEKHSSVRGHEPPSGEDPRPSEPFGSRSGPLLENVERTARTTPKPPNRAPRATSGQATRRGKRAPSNETPSRVPLAAAASTCSRVLSGAPPFWSAALPTLVRVLADAEPLPTTPRRAPRLVVSTGRSGRASWRRPVLTRWTSLALARSSSNNSSI